jgi:hypothetical protein
MSHICKSKRGLIIQCNAQKLWSQWLDHSLKNYNIRNLSYIGHHLPGRPGQVRGGLDQARKRKRKEEGSQGGRTPRGEES